MLARMDGGQAGYWRDRLAMAGELMEAFQTGQALECTPVIRELLRRFAGDSKWDVRKVVANGLALIEDDVFDELAPRLLCDSNAYVKRAAEQGYSRRRQRLRDVHKKESADKRVARRLSRLRRDYGDDAAREVFSLSESRFCQLAGSIAHDLRSVLTHLRPAAKGLAGGWDNGTDHAILERKAGRVVEGLAFMERCVTDMERYTEPLPVERHPEDLAEVVTAACEMARGNIEDLGFDSHRVVLRQEVPDGLRLRISRYLMILALSNLVKNAYESFMKPQRHLRRGEVTVSAEADGDTVRIVVRDNGMGMTAENLAELLAFLPRRRNKAKRKSTGFGIPIARRYIEAHHGTLTFESEEDVGTAAIITLPKTPPSGEDAQ